METETLINEIFNNACAITADRHKWFALLVDCATGFSGVSTAEDFAAIKPADFKMSVDRRDDGSYPDIPYFWLAVIEWGERTCRMPIPLLSASAVAWFFAEDPHIIRIQNNGYTLRGVSLDEIAASYGVYPPHGNGIFPRGQLPRTYETANLHYRLRTSFSECVGGF